MAAACRPRWNISVRCEILAVDSSGPMTCRTNIPSYYFCDGPIRSSGLQAVVVDEVSTGDTNTNEESPCLSRKSTQNKSHQ